jgi:hypothetical protein
MILRGSDMAKIQDGKGFGFEAGVDSTNRLLTESVALAIREEAVVKGDSFEIGASVTLTGTSETALLFVENEGATTLIIDRFEFSGAESSGGTSDAVLLALYTGASAITSGTASAAVNANFGSALALDATVEVGNGSTSAVTGGTQFGASYIRFLGQTIFDGPWAVPRGSSFALTVTPPASNTSLPFVVRVLTHLQRSE